MIDPIAATVLEAGTKTAASKVTSKLVEKILIKPARTKLETIRFDLNTGLPEYLLANYAKCNTLKTLLNRNDPVKLSDCFVSPNFRLSDEDKSSEEFLTQVDQLGGKVVISGLAGSGKTVFLKYLFSYVIERGRSHYPIFFELRELNALSSKKGDFLLSAIYSSIHSCCNSFTRAQFNHGLKKGAFFFLLDGFDELRQEISEKIAVEINALARTYHKCSILVSSRPSDAFVSWEGFSEAKLLPFDLKKVVEYISKLKFDEERKRDFIADLEGGLFEKNRDFLSNPLLSAMMLLTYESFGEVPEKRHIFYAKCFDVLATEHDASKGRYKRELFSSLTMDQLEEVFMYFCALSFIEQVVSFTETEMKKFVGEAISAGGFSAEVAAVIRDFRESISIMELVGLNYEFAHRSFQEYYYAKFTVRDRELPLKKKMDWLITELMARDTIDMIADMDRAYFEDEFFLPHVRALDEKFARIDQNVNPAGVLSKFFSRIAASGSGTGDGKTSWTIMHRISDHGNWALYQHAVATYQGVVSLSLAGVSIGRPWSVEEFNDLASMLFREFGGEVKVHHANNGKLKRIGGDVSASLIKNDITTLRRHLEEKRARRRGGLSALILGKYK